MASEAFAGEETLERSPQGEFNFDFDLTAESTLPPITGRGTRATHGEASADESNPLQELVGGGRNWKYVQGCRELHLGRRGFRKLANFEPLVNLEALWINGNRLSYVTGLDNNTRLKELYAHDNQIGTLQGSLKLMKFLEVLDLSNNKLRNLDKILHSLQELKFIRNLNLRGNPCCEEPDYRLFVIHRMPWVRVLDQHVVTIPERIRAAKLLDPASQARGSVAFGSRAPEFYGPWNDPVTEVSVLGQRLHRQAERLRSRHVDRGRHEDETLFTSLGVERPDLVPATVHMVKKYPPPPPGWDPDISESYEQRFRSPADAPPLVRPDSPGPPEAGEAPPSRSSQRGAGPGPAEKLTHREILAMMQGQQSQQRLRGVASAGGSPTAERDGYRPRDIYRFTTSERHPVEGLSTGQESKSVRFTSTGLRFDREGFRKYAKRKQYSQPGTLKRREVRV